MSKQIVETINTANPGTIFLASDFTETDTDDAICKTLSRLVAAGKLERPLRGLYRKPKHNDFLDRDIPASPNENAQALAKKFGWNIAPFGDTALNQLGLDAQVPTAVCYVSNRPYRTYHYDPYTIEFRHTANRNISNLNPETALVIQDLKALGKEQATLNKLDLISLHLDDSQLNNLVSDTHNVAVWIRDAIGVIQKRRTP